MTKHQRRLAQFMDRHHTGAVWCKRRGWVWRSDCYMPESRQLCKRAAKQLGL